MTNRITIPPPFSLKLDGNDITPAVRKLTIDPVERTTMIELRNARHLYHVTPLIGAITPASLRIDIPGRLPHLQHVLLYDLHDTTATFMGAT